MFIYEEILNDLIKARETIVGLRKERDLQSEMILKLQQSNSELKNNLKVLTEEMKKLQAKLVEIIMTPLKKEAFVAVHRAFEEVGREEENAEEVVLLLQSGKFFKAVIKLCEVLEDVGGSRNEGESKGSDEVDDVSEESECSMILTEGFGLLQDLGAQNSKMKEICENI